MAWGSNPQFTIYGKLSYERCAQLFDPHPKTGMFNISTQRPTRSNYHIRKVPDGYALKMYNTDIITWYKDSSIVYIPYDSSITRSTMNEFGPLRIWSNKRAAYRCNERFGNWGRGVNYPFAPSRYSMKLDADGYIRGLFDESQWIKPERRGPRREKLKKFREMALGRIMLGEFDNLATHGTHKFRRKTMTGWWAALPFDRKTLFNLLLSGMTFDEINAYLKQSVPEPACPAESKPQAFVKAVQCIARAGVDDYHDYEWHRVDYDPVNWRDL